MNHHTFAECCHAQAIEPDDISQLNVSSNEVFMFLGAGNVNEMCYNFCLDLEKYCEPSS